MEGDHARERKDLRSQELEKYEKLTREKILVEQELAGTQRMYQEEVLHVKNLQEEIRQIDMEHETIVETLQSREARASEKYEKDKIQWEKAIEEAKAKIQSQALDLNKLQQEYDEIQDIATRKLDRPAQDSLLQEDLNTTNLAGAENRERRQKEKDGSTTNPVGTIVDREYLAHNANMHTLEDQLQNLETNEDAANEARVMPELVDLSQGEDRVISNLSQGTNFSIRSPSTYGSETEKSLSVETDFSLGRLLNESLDRESFKELSKQKRLQEQQAFLEGIPHDSDDSISGNVQTTLDMDIIANEMQLEGSVRFENENLEVE